MNSVMAFKELDINKLSRLISPHVDEVTCIECCKYYMAPTTAQCGHTLCHVCWLGRKKCAICGKSVDRKSLRLNLVLQKLTENIQCLQDEYESIFKVKLDEFSLDTPVEKECNKDPSKSVRDWLANSENQFSAPQASQQSIQDFNNQQIEMGSKIQTDSKTCQMNSTKNTVHVRIPQDDWDKIEELPDSEDLPVQNKENAVGPMDIEPFVVHLHEFTTDKPRRSTRNKDNKGDTIPNADFNMVDENSMKNSTIGIDSKVLKNKRNWTNVKRMKKEFSKLNKQSKNKLNVSIEMCKKTQITANKNLPLKNIADLEDMHLNNNNNNMPNIGVPKDCAGLTLNMIKNKSPISNLLKDISDSEIQNNIKCKPQLDDHIKQVFDNTKLKNNSLSDAIEPNKTTDYKIPSVAFIMKGALQAPSLEKDDNYCDKNNIQYITVNTDNVTKKSEDIEITIKIGNTLTNICIKKNDKDVQLKIKADREIQTSLENCKVDNKQNASCSPIKEVDLDSRPVQNKKQNSSEHVENLLITSKKVESSIKTSSTKKNTESADTATVQYEITESIEKELSKEMEKVDVSATQVFSENNKKANKQTSDNDALDEDCLNDLDLFENDSVKEVNVQSLKSSNQAPSEILLSTIKSKRQVDKRVRDTISDDLPVSKKMKIIQGQENQKIVNKSQAIQAQTLYPDSEHTNYDLIMGQVFANIDLDLAIKSNENNIKISQLKTIENNKIVTSLKSKVTHDLCDSTHGQSENMFSLLEKESDICIQPSNVKIHMQLDNLEVSSHKPVDDVEMIEEELGTPIPDICNHSDESIVEETPQKDSSTHKLKQKSNGSVNKENNRKNKSLKLKRNEIVPIQNKTSHTPGIMSVINLSDITDDTTRKSKQVTVMETIRSRPTLETPLNINNFVDQIKHKSTPVAKKSLNFDNDNTENSNLDPEQTLCPESFLVARTTQEKEFMCKAFEDSPQTRSKSPLTMRNIRIRATKFCLAGSCLMPSEITNVKLLCSLRKWDYVDKYTKELTHLVVGVDDENKSQRSVKYMCALAASKWIVSYEWIQKCLQTKTVVDEELYEALDNTGEPGPRRSRVAKQKLFKGITFFCMPPFSVLDVDTLKEMLEAAGGRVVGEAKDVRVTGASVALLLAEPEHTLEDRFIYLAMELSIVPVNSEWVLNCLGSYSISSIQELLLCPETLLPPATRHWPPELMAKEFD